MIFPLESLVNSVYSTIRPYIDIKDLEDKELFVKAVGAV